MAAADDQPHARKHLALGRDSAGVDVGLQVVHGDQRQVHDLADILLGEQRVQVVLLLPGITAPHLQQQLDELAASRNQLRRKVGELTMSSNAAIADVQTAQKRIEKLVAMLEGETQTPAEPQTELIVINQEAEDIQPPVIEVDRRPVLHSFDSNRLRIMPGQTSTLSWQVSNAQRVRIEPEVGPVSALGSRTVKPSATTTYTLIATNQAGERRLSHRIEISERINIFSSDSIGSRALLEEYKASDDSKVLSEQKPPVSDPNETQGKFLGYRARQDESGKFLFIPVYENKQEE